MPTIDGNACRPRPFDNDLPEFAISDLEECITYLKKWARSRRESKFDIIVEKYHMRKVVRRNHCFLPWKGPIICGDYAKVNLFCYTIPNMVRIAMDFTLA